MGKMQRDKGKRNERECAGELTAATGHKFNTNLEEVRGGRLGVDVLSSFCPIIAQVKSGRNPPMMPALREVLAAAQQGEWAVAKIKRDHKGAVGLLRWPDLMLLFHIMAERTDGRLRL